MRRSLIWPIYAPSFLLAFSRGLLTPVLPLYAASFGIPYALIGLVLAAQGLGTLFGDVPAGIILNRLSYKRAMTLGVAMMASATLAMVWARGFLDLMIYGLIVGLGGALWNLSRHAYLTNATPSSGRGRAIAGYGGINRIGVFMGPAVGGTLATVFDLRAPFLVYAAIAGIALLFPIMFVSGNMTPLHKRQQHSNGDHVRSLWIVMKTQYRVLMTAGSGQLFAQMIRSGRRIIVPLYGADVLGLDPQAIGWIVSIAGAIDMSMFYPAGVVMDRFGRKFAYVPSFFIQSIGMALIPFSSGFMGLMLATSVIGFGNGLGSGTMMTLGADLAPKRRLGEFLGVWRLIGDTGQSGGPIVVGNVADILGLSSAAFVIAGIGLLAATTLWLLVPETLQPPGSQQLAGEQKKHG